MIDTYGNTGGTAGARALSIDSSCQVCFNSNNNDGCISATIPLDKWSFIGYVYTQLANVVIYNGETGTSVSLGSSDVLNTGSGAHIIGAWGASSFTFTGYIANIQLYNTSVSSSVVNGLYLEGIGGAPLVLQNLFGWWPMNGNGNDYSGNNHNVQATGANVVFNTTWYSKYTPP